MKTLVWEEDFLNDEESVLRVDGVAVGKIKRAEGSDKWLSIYDGKVLGERASKADAQAVVSYAARVIISREE